jgi:Na+-translocating ferredoxin:NAD+ oxidoreductase RnfG subunit
MPPVSVVVEDIRDLFPSAQDLAVALDERGRRQVLGHEGEVLGSFLRTSPLADAVIGFCGPTDTLLAFDRDDRVLGVKILNSEDTRDHVAQIRNDANFLSHLRGLTWSEASTSTKVDGVAGATLTSIAIQEGLLLRLGGGEVSLRFRDLVELQDVHDLFPNATRLEPMVGSSSRWSVIGAGNTKIGSLLRTAPASDAIVGYQGPSDTLMGFDPDGRVTGLKLLKTYDNEEYAVDLREDDYYPKQFFGLSLAELGALDLKTAGIDGVSGSTLISNAVTEGLVIAAKRASAPPPPWLDWQLRDLGTAIVVLLGLVIGLSSLRANKKLRVAFLLVLVAYLGVMNADMLSCAQLVGWAQYGIPWHTAGGLFLLTSAAFLVPLSTNRNLYCSHLCPHGALQQLVRGRFGRPVVVSKRLARTLRLVPFGLLAVCLVVAMTGAVFSLVDLEPFDAWVYSVAGWPTLAIAGVGLVASFFVPMAYCRYGCPTGAILRFLAHNDQWSRRDTAATTLVLVATALSL